MRLSYCDAGCAHIMTEVLYYNYNYNIEPHPYKSTIVRIIMIMISPFIITSTPSYEHRLFSVSLRVLGYFWWWQAGVDKGHNVEKQKVEHATAISISFNHIGDSICYVPV